jgi:S-adenosylmethionine decarboxylase
MIGAMRGLHLTADLSGCPASAALREPESLRALCLQAVARSGLTAVGELFHRFGGEGGVTGVVLLAESHLAVHTWPELGAVTLDAYVCNFGHDNSARAEVLVAALIEGFSPRDVARQRLARG